MSLLFLLTVMVIILAPIGIVAAVVLTFAQRSPALATPTPAELPDPVRLHSQRTNVATWSVAILTIVALAVTLPAITQQFVSAVGPEGPTGLTLALAPLIVALVYTLARLVAERTWPRPDGQVRAATLANRSTAMTSPRGLRTITITWAMALLALLVGCGITGDGNRFTRSYLTDQGVITTSAGPFPGWPYGVPTLVVATLVSALTVLTLVTIRRRPAVATLDAPEDLALRRRASTHELVLVQSALGLTLAGNAAFAGFAWRSTGLTALGLGSLTAAVVIAIATVVASLSSLAARR